MFDTRYHAATATRKLSLCSVGDNDDAAAVGFETKMPSVEATRRTIRLRTTGDASQTQIADRVMVPALCGVI